MAKPDVQLRYDAAASVPRIVVCDPNRLSQIISNLVI